MPKIRVARQVHSSTGLFDPVTREKDEKTWHKVLEVSEGEDVFIERHTPGGLGQLKIFAGVLISNLDISNLRHSGVEVEWVS